MTPKLRVLSQLGEPNAFTCIVDALLISRHGGGVLDASFITGALIA